MRRSSILQRRKTGNPQARARATGAPAGLNRRRAVALASVALAVVVSASGMGALASPGQRWGPKYAAAGGRAFVTLKGDVENSVVGPWQVSGVFRAIESNKAVRIRNLTIDGITATDLERDGIRLRGDASGVTIRNFTLRMRSQPQFPPNLPIGIAVQQGQDITISDGSISGFQMAEIFGKYTNGDGIASERPVHRLSILRVRSTDNSDGGFDLKSHETRLDQLTAERNGRNYRLWTTVEADTLTSVDPRNAHIWVAKGAQVHVRKLIARSRTSAPLIRVEGPAQVVIDSCSLQLPPGTALIAGDPAGSVVRLGAGCRN